MTRRNPSPKRQSPSEDSLSAQELQHRITATMLANGLDHAYALHLARALMPTVLQAGWEPRGPAPRGRDRLSEVAHAVATAAHERGTLLGPSDATAVAEAALHADSGWAAAHGVVATADLLGLTTLRVARAMWSGLERLLPTSLAQRLGPDESEGAADAGLVRFERVRP